MVVKILAHVGVLLVELRLRSHASLHNSKICSFRIHPIALNQFKNLTEHLSISIRQITTLDE